MTIQNVLSSRINNLFWGKKNCLEISTKYIICNILETGVYKVFFFFLTNIISLIVLSITDLVPSLIPPLRAQPVMFKCLCLTGSGTELSWAALTCPRECFWFKKDFLLHVTGIKPRVLHICFFSYRLFSDVLLTTSEKPQFKVKQII